MSRFVVALTALFFVAACANPPDGEAPTGPRPGAPVFSAVGPNMHQYASPFGDYPRADTRNWWQTGYAVDAYSRLDEIWPSSVARRAEAPSPWKRPAVEPEIIYDGTARLGAGRFDIDGYLARNPATGLLIAQGDTILVERYRYGRNDSHRLTSFSMAKTVIALLIGIAVEEGKIASIEDKAERYVPSLAGTEYGATPIRHLLTMSSGVQFREDYSGNDDSYHLSRATFGRETAGGASVARLFNDRIARPGLRWYYSSAETYVLALVLREATGKPVADYLSEKIWRPIGAESDASWMTDGAGNEVGYMGLNAALRDWARLGRMLAEGGRFEGKQIVPAAWLAEATRAHFSGNVTGRWYGYGFQTWVFPENDGSYALLGVRGQTLFVDPRKKLIMVHTAVRPQASDPGGAEAVALWRAIRNRF
ncbi:MAG: serine hydrolase [Alphaproteobacteria bacterium]|nr:serine hydrolase [Alphaproteobacteria bacterium]